MPTEVEKEMKWFSDAWLAGHDAKRHDKSSYPGFDGRLSLQLYPQRCRDDQLGESDNRHHYLIGAEEIFCATNATLDWCEDEMVILYKSVRKTYRSDAGSVVDVIFTCYRSTYYGKLLHDVDTYLFTIVVTVLPVVLAFNDWRFMKTDDDPKSVESSPSPPPRPSRSTRDPNAPLPNIASRHDNYRKKRRSNP
ncbi:unnamed protein product [Caenorhabditis sp. 36 PRJEB53466]|nr:unnamed protein product [Caenorhabditis sp. 36 PRJEB53466]